MSTSTVTVDLQHLVEAHSQAQRAEICANKAVRKAEDNLREAQDTQREAALAVETLAVIIRAVTA